MALAANEGTGWVINARGEYETTSDGHWKRDSTIATRVRIRLLTRRGEFFADPELGSRLHEIKTTKDAKRRAQVAIIEALQPLMDEGAIASVNVDDISVHPESGAMVIRLIIDTPDESSMIETVAIGG